MTFSDYEPTWVPVDSEGTAWRLLSWKRRVLGTVVKTKDNDFRGRKLCCSKSIMGDIYQAARYVRTALKCTDCLPS